MTDAKGFRVGQNGGVVAPTRVLLLGDSFGAALQVQYEESLPGLLERRLPTVLGRRVAVHNTAVNGHSPSQYLIRARQELAREPYGLVLVMFFLGNDILEDRAEYYPPLQQTNVRNFRVPRHATWTEIVDAMLYPINDFLKQHSHLFVLAKNQARTVLMRMGLTYLHIPYEVLRANAADRRWA